MTAGTAAAFCVVLPLAAALAAMAAGRHAARLAWPTAVVLPGLAALVVWDLVRVGPQRVAIGGWDVPLGIALAVDGLSGAFVVTTALVMACVVVVARPTFGMKRGETRAGFVFWPLTFFLWAGLNAVFLSGDLFNLYVALELLTLSAIGLVAVDGKSETVAAAIRYAMFALFGSLLYLLGVALLYAAYGTLDMDLLAGRVSDEPATLAAGALMTAGLAAKTALFPFHGWLPPAHSGAPAPASAMLSGLVPKASFYIVLRLWFDVMPEAAGVLLPQVLGALGAAAIVYGSLLAILQDRLKLVVAYSTVAQLGYLFLVFPLAGGEGLAQPWSAGAWTGGIFHAMAHASAKAAMFLCAGFLLHAVGHDRLSGLAGTARTMPITIFAFGLAAVSLMGLPPSGGFIAKYLLLTAAIASGQVVWALVMLAGGVLAALYLFRPLIWAFVERDVDHRVVPRGRQLVPLALAGLSIALGIASALPFDFLQIGRSEATGAGLE